MTEALTALAANAGAALVGGNLVYHESPSAAAGRQHPAPRPGPADDSPHDPR
ncbi:hypothetical protein Q3W71_15960 [Micromonospora sp. C28SCA-DRY-2]|uniref:hypothetical protein n=1 Tax=Micromonospora sp. C28SCA-DRY-2 TaxID=3059522 RepID=UPI002676F55A|nr:hypothetical protein [Micromonospora sp. C28SCA-DRY-2]MDO3703167.1 hypothetical protein [Micromonospora sp. C28SCA-DRY-2]